MGPRQGARASGWWALALACVLSGACSFPDYDFVPKLGAGGSGSGASSGTPGVGGVAGTAGNSSGGSGAETGEAGAAGDGAGAVSAAGGAGATGGEGPGTGGAQSGGEGGASDRPVVCDDLVDVPSFCVCDERDHAYLFCISPDGPDTERLSFSEASNFCVSNAGMKLARVDTFNENEWLTETAGARAEEVLPSSEPTYPWIGGTSSGTPGTWHWQDGDVFWQGDWNGEAVDDLYSKWRDGAPPADTGYCAYLSTVAWDFANCGNARDWICEAY